MSHQCVWIVIRNFLLEKQPFNGLFKVIDIQIILVFILHVTFEYIIRILSEQPLDYIYIDQPSDVSSI